MPNFILGPTSLKRLSFAEANLRTVVNRAIQLSEIDFGVTDSIRTVEQQRSLVNSGASQTMNSRHLPNGRGLCEAVDLAAYLDTDGDGKKEFSWHEGHYVHVAVAMMKAAIETGVRIRWGGSWTTLNDIAGKPSVDTIRDAVEDYVRRRTNAGKRAFIDAPHYELHFA